MRKKINRNVFKKARRTGNRCKLKYVNMQSYLLHSRIYSPVFSMSKGIYLMCSWQVWSKTAWVASWDCQLCTLLILDYFCLVPAGAQDSPARVPGGWADSTAKQPKVETGKEGGGERGGESAHPAMWAETWIHGWYGERPPEIRDLSLSRRKLLK